VPRIEILHNIHRDASFGLNCVFFRQDQGGHVKETESRAHDLVKVFEYDDNNGPVSPEHRLENAFELFNIGHEHGGKTALAYRARNLRSLSVGDVVKVDGVPYACESAGWKQVAETDLRVLGADEAEPVIRARYEFGDGEELSITVPLEDRTVAEHEHSFLIQTGIPRKIAGAFLGYSDYRKCTGCEQRVSAECVKPDGSLMP
jgi:hypothetical protein